jgi:hypothetical protein
MLEISKRKNGMKLHITKNNNIFIFNLKDMNQDLIEYV